MTGRKKKVRLKNYELNLNKTKDFDIYIESTLESQVRAVVKHFSFRFRKGCLDDVDEEYLYHKQQIELFEQLYEDMYEKKFETFLKKYPQATKNDFEKKFERAKIKPIFFEEEDSSPTCWCIYRENSK